MHQKAEYGRRMSSGSLLEFLMYINGALLILPSLPSVGELVLEPFEFNK
jgi:hypothetical protein